LAFFGKKPEKTGLAGMAHPPKRGKRAQKKGAFGPFRPKKVAALIIWHEFLTSGRLLFFGGLVERQKKDEAAGQKFVPKDGLAATPLGSWPP
jgi:hypothetical protein